MDTLILCMLYSNMGQMSIKSLKMVGLLFFMQVGKETLLFKALIKNGANVNEKGDNVFTALLLASCNRYTRIVNILLHEKGMNIHANDNDFGKTALIEACRGAHSCSVNALLFKHGAGVSINKKKI